MSSAAFTDAWDKVSAMGEKLKVAGKPGPTNDEQLQMYAYGKVAKGNNIDDAKKPGMFDMTGKAKYNKWKEVVDAGTTQQEAEAKYVEIAQQVLVKYDK